MGKIKLFKTYNRAKHVLVKPKLKIGFGWISKIPFHIPRHYFSLFDKHAFYNPESGEREYDSVFVGKMRKIFPKFPVKPIRFTLPDWLTFGVYNYDFQRKWKYDEARYEGRGHFSICVFGFVLSFYLEVPLDGEEMYHEDGYYEFMMEFLDGTTCDDLIETIKAMGMTKSHSTKYGERKYPTVYREWIRPEWRGSYDIAIKELKAKNRDQKQEWILCSAIKRVKRRECDNPYHEGTNDILDIELGYRHHDIFYRFHQEKEVDIHMESQGFYTSRGRFVGRKEAAEIAYAAGQIKKPVARLCSEDLY